MRKLIFLFIACTTLIVGCKKDPPFKGEPDPLDPDSLYVSTPYTLPALITSGLRYRKIISPADNPLTVEGIQLGRMLFYDPVLSADSSVSCASCHKQEHGFGDNIDFSTRVFGQKTTRHGSTLINQGMDRRFFWDGRTTTLELAVEDALKGEQTFTFATSYIRLKNQERYTKLFKKTFGRPGDITEANIHKAIAQFLRSIVSIDSKYDLSLRGQYTLTSDERAGFNMFTTEKADCFHCHADGPFQTFANQIQLFANNGLDSVSSANDFKDFGLGDFTKNQFDNGRFKIPTLRNIEKSAPYMHDGRFKTLEEVVDFYSSGVKRAPTTDPLMTHAGQGGIQLNPTEKTQLIAFLKTLTDVGFETNPAYSNPF